MAKKNILIVEDETTLLDVLSEALNEAGFVTAKARNGEEGLAAVKQNKPDLILIDILMPRMDGITMLQTLRADKLYQNIPVVVLTNLNDSKTVSQALESGVYDYLVKSNWEPNSIVRFVQDKLTVA